VMPMPKGSMARAPRSLLTETAGDEAGSWLAAD